MCPQQLKKLLKEQTLMIAEKNTGLASTACVAGASNGNTGNTLCWDKLVTSEGCHLFKELYSLPSMESDLNTKQRFLPDGLPADPGSWQPAPPTTGGHS